MVFAWGIHICFVFMHDMTVEAIYRRCLAWGLWDMWIQAAGDQTIEIRSKCRGGFHYPDPDGTLAPGGGAKLLPALEFMWRSQHCAVWGVGGMASSQRPVYLDLLLCSCRLVSLPPGFLVWTTTSMKEQSQRGRRSQGQHRLFRPTQQLLPYRLRVPSVQLSLVSEHTTSPSGCKRKGVSSLSAQLLLSVNAC